MVVRLGLLVMVAAVGIVLSLSLMSGDAAARHKLSTAEVFLLEDPETIVGGSTLVRTNQWIETAVHTTELEREDVVTIWWVIFNRPERCSDGECGEDDVLVFDDEGNLIGNVDARVSVLWATGIIVPGGGVGSFYARLDRNDAPGEVLFGPGLTNPMGAEVHLVLRTHGQPIPGQISEQLSTFAGGCDENECIDLQAAIHMP